MDLYPNREVFPASPLALVAAEIRFTDAARLRQQATLDAISIALEDRFPIARPVQQMDFQIVVGAAPQAAPLPPTSTVIHTDRHNTESIGITSTSLTYETTHYTEFADLLEVVQRACRALVEAGVRPAVERIGLRYIDEVRVPELIEDARQWVEWIDYRLVDHLNVGPKGQPVTMAQGLTTYDLGEGMGLNFRYAALNSGVVVDPQVLARRRHSEPGPLFVLDYDGYQTFLPQSAVTLDPEVVGKSLTAVHSPAGEAFQNSITDKARELFRGDPA